MARTLTLRIGHPRGSQDFTPLATDTLGLTDSLAITRGLGLTDNLGLTDSRSISSGAGLGLAPLGTTPLGG